MPIASGLLYDWPNRVDTYVWLIGFQIENTWEWSAKYIIYDWLYY